MKCYSKCASKLKLNGKIPELKNLSSLGWHHLYTSERKDSSLLSYHESEAKKFRPRGRTHLGPGIDSGTAFKMKIRNTSLWNGQILVHEMKRYHFLMNFELELNRFLPSNPFNYSLVSTARQALLRRDWGLGRFFVTSWSRYFLGQWLCIRSDEATWWKRRVNRKSSMSTLSKRSVGTASLISLKEECCCQRKLLNHLLPTCKPLSARTVWWFYPHWRESSQNASKS